MPAPSLNEGRHLADGVTPKVNIGRFAPKAKLTLSDGRHLTDLAAPKLDVFIIEIRQPRP